jgi:hypothetical protein
VKKNGLSQWRRKRQLLPLGEEKFDYPREAKKKSIIAVRRDLPSGGFLP